jgi:hypothetical protein
LPNGNTLILANFLHPVPGFSQPQVLDDVIYEIEPGGAIVWKWIASEHLDEFGFAPNEWNLIRNAKTADYLHVNNMSVLGANHWFSAGDKRFDPDNVLIDSRNANVTVISLCPYVIAGSSIIRLLINAIPLVKTTVTENIGSSNRVLSHICSKLNDNKTVLIISRTKK